MYGGAVTHYFFYLILVAILVLGAVTIPLTIFYGNNPFTIVTIIFIGVIIVVLIIIFRSYLRDKSQASRIFPIIPCRFGIGRRRNGLWEYCRRCTSTYQTLILIAVFVTFAEGHATRMFYNPIILLFGTNGVLMLSIICILSIPIQATIYAYANKESDRLRTITGVFFGVGVYFLFIYLSTIYNL